MKISYLLKQIFQSKIPNIKDLVFLLAVSEPKYLQEIYDFADEIRQKYVGNKIYLRGLIEISNCCDKTCTYCGLNKNNTKLERYTLKSSEIFESVDLIVQDKIKTIVLQSGEQKIDIYWIAEIIKTVKKKYPELAITLSLGEKTFEEYEILKNAGADRYLLKIETFNKKLYERLHPSMSFENRIECLDNLRKLKFQVGSGNIVGLKGQTFEDLAFDLQKFAENEYDMLSVSPFLPHPETLLSSESKADVNLVFKVLALTRITSKNAHIPATSALGSMGEDYRIKALTLGANVIMPNYTPHTYKKLYEIYPGKKCLTEDAKTITQNLYEMAESLGRKIGEDRGDSLKSCLDN